MRAVSYTHLPNAAACRSLELGVIRCIDETMEQVRRSTGLSVTDIQSERVLNGNSFSLDPKAKEIIQKNGRSYTERILSAIMEAGFDLRAIPSVFMGGGSTIVRRHVTPQDRLCRAFYLTDVKADVYKRQDPELKRRLQKIFPVLRDRREKAGKATTLLWEYIYDYLKKNRLFTNKEALEEIFEAVPDSYVKFRIWDVHQLEKKKEKNKKKEECR